MREMKDSGVSWIGEIPLQWDVYRNKDGFINTKTIVGKKSKNTSLLSLTTKGIKLKDIDNPEGKQPESFDTYQCVEVNDLVMCLFDLDISAVFSGLSSYNGMISPAYKVLKCNERVIAKYADYWFRYIFDGRKFNQYAKNIRYTLTYDVFSALPMLYPPVEEQQYIVNYLDTKCTQIDTIIAKEQSVIEKLQEYKRAIITNAVVKGLDETVETADSGIEWIESIPIHWKIKRLIFSAYIRARLGWKGLKADEYTSEGHPFLSAVNIQNDKLVWEDLNFINDDRYDESPEIKLELGDLLLVKDGAGIGKCAVVDQLPFGTATTNSSLGVITPYPELNSMYLYYFFESAIFQNYISRIKNGMGVPHLTQGNLKNIMVVIPPYCEQEAIVAYLDEKCANLDSLIVKKQSLIDKLSEYKQSLIYEVVTGKKEVPYV